jgi:hypothetical protein
MTDLNRGACMRSMQSELGIWEPIQHVLKDKGKQKKTCVEMAGRRTCDCTPSTSQQSSKQKNIVANARGSDYL